MFSFKSQADMVWRSRKTNSQQLTTSIKRVTIRIHQAVRRVQLNGILHILHLLHNTVAVVQGRGHIDVRQHAHDAGVHALHERLVVGRRPPVHHVRAAAPRQAGRQRPEGRADHDDLGGAPRHQGGGAPAPVAGHAFGVEVRGEDGGFLHAGEGGGGRGRAEAAGAVGGDADGGAGGDLLEDVRDGGAVGVGFEQGGVAVAGGGAPFDVLDHDLEVLPDEGEEVLEQGGFGVGLAGVAEEDLVFPARGCVVGPVVLEEEAGVCGVGCVER